MATATTGVSSPAAVDAPRALRGGAAPLHRSRSGRAAVLVPTALMLLLGLLGLDRRSMWRDEAASLVGARRTLPELWAMLDHVETVHGLYYTLLHGWLQLGSGVVWARVLSVLAMAAAAGLVAVIGARLVSTPVGTVAGLLFAVNPSVSYYAQEARSTALVVAFALLATWFLLRALEGSRGWWPAYAGACLVLVGLNLLASLVPLALVLTLLWWGRTRRSLQRWAVATSPALLLAVALLVVTSQQPYQIGWIPGPGLGSVREFAHLVLGPTRPLVVGVSLLVLAGLAPTRSLPERRLRALALPLLVLPTAALLVVSLVQPVFAPRYVFPSVAAVSLLAAVGAVRLGRVAARRRGGRALALVSVGAVLAVAVAGAGAQRFDRTAASRSDDLAGAAAVVADRARTGDAVLLVPDNRRLVALVYPGAFEGLRDVALAAGPEVVGNLTGRPLPLPVTLRNLADSPRVWVVGRPERRLTPAETDARAELDLLDREFEPVEHAGIHGVDVTLYVRRPASS